MNDHQTINHKLDLLIKNDEITHRLLESIERQTGGVYRGRNERKPDFNPPGNPLIPRTSSEMGTPNEEMFRL